MVSELLNDRNRPLAEVAHVDDVIVSDRIPQLGLMLARLSADHRPEAIFLDLLDADGAEIHLRPAEWDVATGDEVSVATILEAAAVVGRPRSRTAPPH